MQRLFNHRKWVPLSRYDDNDDYGNDDDDVDDTDDDDGDDDGDGDNDNDDDDDDDGDGDDDDDNNNDEKKRKRLENFLNITRLSCKLAKKSTKGYYKVSPSQRRRKETRKATTWLKKKNTSYSAVYLHEVRFTYNKATYHSAFRAPWLASSERDSQVPFTSIESVEQLPSKIIEACSILK